MQELKQQEKRIHEANCKNCGSKILNSKSRLYCSRRCGLLYRDREVYKGQYTKDYYSKNPLNFFRSSLQKKQHKRENISAEFLSELFDKQNGLCAISKEPLTIIRGQGRVMTNASIDRIDSFKPYAEDNIQLVCLIVNLMKQQLTLEELKSWCYKIIRA